MIPTFGGEVQMQIMQMAGKADLRTFIRWGGGRGRG